MNLRPGRLITKTDEGEILKWSLGNRARVKKGHAWSGKGVFISSILPGGSVVRVTDDAGNSTIININHLMKPQQ